MYVYQKFNIKNVSHPMCIINPATPLHDYGYSAVVRIDTSMR